MKRGGSRGDQSPPKFACHRTRRRTAGRPTRGLINARLPKSAMFWAREQEYYPAITFLKNDKNLMHPTRYVICIMFDFVAGIVFGIDNQCRNHPKSHTFNGLQRWRYFLSATWPSGTAHS